MPLTLDQYWSTLVLKELFSHLTFEAVSALPVQFSFGFLSLSSILLGCAKNCYRNSRTMLQCYNLLE